MWRINSWELTEDERAELFQARMLHPDLPALRKRANRELQTAIDRVAAPLGYEQASNGLWLRRGLFATTYVEMQKSKAGDRCFINLGREGRSETTIPSYKNNTAWRLGSFEDSIDKCNRIGSLFYVDLANDSDFIPYLMDLLAKRGMPFLKRCHGIAGASARPPERTA